MLKARFLFCVSATAFLVSTLTAQMAPDSLALTQLLNEFLAGASHNDAAIHDRFWADDLIYTGSSGRRVGKADIMKDVTSASAPDPNDPVTTFTAEDIRIHQYDATAIVAFRLVGTTMSNGKTRVSNFLNSGTFLKRDGEWRVVSWQATRKPKPEDELKKEVSEAGTSLYRALTSMDKKQIETLTDESFIITNSGLQITRKELLDNATSHILKYSLPESDEPIVLIYGDAAIIRYTSAKLQVESAMMAFVNNFGEWKAVAMNINQPRK